MPNSFKIDLIPKFYSIKLVNAVANPIIDREQLQKTFFSRSSPELVAFQKLVDIIGS